jgi:hypothetical protein
MESYGAKERAEEKDVADMEADAAELEKSLFKDSAEATAKPPEVGVSAKPAELKQWEKDVLEASHSDAMKAANDNDIKTAVDCIIANGLHLD